MPFSYSWLSSASGYLAQQQSSTGTRSTIRVNVIGPSETASWYSDVLNKINTARTAQWPGVTLTITQNNNSAYTGNDLTTSNFDCVFIWTDANYTATLGTNLNSYVTAGGNLVIAVFAIASLAIPNFVYTNCPVLFAGNQTFGGNTTLGTVTAGDPLVKGVSSFNVGSAGFAANNLTAQSGATVVATYNGGNILVAKKTIGTARTVALNFFPPSSTSRNDFWTASTNGGELMVNAIVWAGRGV